MCPVKKGIGYFFAGLVARIGAVCSGGGPPVRMAPVTDGSAQGLAKLVDDHIKDNAIMVRNSYKL